MKRRDFVRAGLAVPVVASAACATTGPGGRAAASAGLSGESEALIARIDNALALTDHPEALRNVFPTLPGLQDGTPAAELVRSVLKTLTMVAFFRDVPAEDRFHPEVQRRMWHAAPDIEGAVRGVTHVLRNLTREQSAQLGPALRRDPGLPMRICAALDGASASQDALSRSRRLQLRNMVTELSFRLQHQPPAVVIDDLVQRVDRLDAQLEPHPGAEAMISAAEAPDAAMRFAAWGRDQTAGGGEDNEHRWPFWEATATVGLVICGIGLVVGIGSLALTSVYFPFVFVATAGALLLIVGLIVVAVGLAGMTYDLVSPLVTAPRQSARQRFRSQVRHELDAVEEELARRRRREREGGASRDTTLPDTRAHAGARRGGRSGAGRAAGGR